MYCSHLDFSFPKRPNTIFPKRVPGNEFIITISTYRPTVQDGKVYCPKYY